MMQYLYEGGDMNQDEIIFKLDKEYTPYLLKAISAVMNSEFVTSGMHDISKYYISFDSKTKKRANSICYTIRFYAHEITQDNWMDMSAGIAGGVNVDIDIKTQEIIYIYGER